MDTADTIDRIDRKVEIAAPAGRVWALVSEPGWFLNDGELVEHRIESEGDLHVVHDPAHGPFALRTVSLDAPRYAAFRWYADVGDPDGPSTLVEFWIEETTPTSVVLRVAESGFDALPGSARERRARFEENARGWATELDLAKVHLEGAGTRAGR